VSTAEYCLLTLAKSTYSARRTGHECSCLCVEHERATSHAYNTKESEKLSESRTNEKKAISVDKRKPVMTGQNEKKTWLLDVTGSTLVIIIGLVIYNALGLAEGVDSLMGKISIGIMVVSCYVVVFRYALRSK